LPLKLIKMVFLGRGNSQVTALPFLYFKIAYIS
jgi:hypothetical protein